MITVKSFIFSPIQENTYIIFNDEFEAWIIDPGCYDSNEQQVLINYISENKLTVKKIINTHGHLDHIFGNYFLKKHYSVPIAMHSDDIFLYARAEQMAALWGLNFTPSPPPDEDLKDVTELMLGREKFEIRFVPGHSPGHIILIHHNSKNIIAGDTIFNGSIGRTDLPGGNHTVLVEKIESQIFTLPDEYVIYCGHGIKTTVGHEKSTNPFFNH